MKYLIIGTAGHVDHGKSALIKALTGTDTDRLKEEKQRGISIDLGFASLKVTNDIMAGIVDVPGHERFLKNMLAGTGGIDLAMLVIAADEGVMPQTREHLAMLDLYGIKEGIVVINKIDKVDSEWAELIEEDIKGILKGSFLENAPFCRVSAVTGTGIENLRSVLAQTAAKINTRDNLAPFRMWIDRVFTVKGHGVVVTGSALSGTTKVSDTLTIYPVGKQVRVRGLEWHGEKAESIYAGQRSAINIAGVETEEVHRGMSLSATARGELSSVWDIKVEWVEDVPTNTRVRLHIGTGEYLGRIHRYKNRPAEFCRLILEEEMAAGAGDRGILRLYSPQHLLGGVLLIAPSRKSQRFGQERMDMAKALLAEDYPALLYLVLAETSKPLTFEDIKRRIGYIPDGKANDCLMKLLKEQKVQRIQDSYICVAVMNDLTKKVREMLAEYHRLSPERTGLPKEVVRQRLGMDDKGFEIVYAAWLDRQLIINYGSEIALVEHKAKHSNWQNQITAQAEELLKGVGFGTVDLSVIEKNFKVSLDVAKKIHDALIKGGLLIRIGDLYLTQDAIKDALQALKNHFASKPAITVAELRDILATSRKVAMPLMEYFDSQKYTIRDGDSRRPGSKLNSQSK